MKTLPAVLLVAFFAITACTKQTEPQVHDVAYFKNNAEARKKTLEECGNNPGQLGMTPNCINAAQAQEMVDAERPWK